MRVVMQDVLPRDRRRRLARSERQRANAGKVVADIGLREPGAGEQMRETLEEVVDLLRAGLRIVWRVAVRYLAGANKNLPVPRDNEDWPAIDRLTIDCLCWSAAEAGQHQMRAAHTADHLWRCNTRGGNHRVGPGTRGVNDVGGLNCVLLRGDAVAQARAVDASIGACNFQKLRMIADDRAGLNGFHQPLGHKALRKFALRILVAVNRPRIAVVELPLKRADIACIGVLPAGPAMVEPQAGPDGKRTAHE